MASLEIAEYLDAVNGNPIEPPAAIQVVHLGSEPTQSKPFHRGAHIVRLIADADCRVTFGTDPQEATSFLRAGQEMVRAVHAGGGFRVCAALASPDAEGAAASANGAAAFLAFVHVLADGNKRKALAEKLDRKHADVRAAIRELGDLKAASA